MNPVAVRPGKPGDGIITGYRVLGPMPCQGCGRPVHVVHRWAGRFLVHLDGEPCAQLGPGHANVLGHDRASCAVCHRLENERYARE